MDPPIKLNKTHNFPSDLAYFSARFLITLSSRRSEERPQSGVRSRLESSDGYKSDDGMSRSLGYKSSSSSSMRDRIGPGGDSRDYGGEKSPRNGRSSVRDRVGVRDAKSPSIRDRLGDHTNGNSDSRKIYSRLGNRDRD